MVAVSFRSAGCWRSTDSSSESDLLEASGPRPSPTSATPRFPFRFTGCLSATAVSCCRFSSSRGLSRPLAFLSLRQPSFRFVVSSASLLSGWLPPFSSSQTQASSSIGISSIPTDRRLPTSPHAPLPRESSELAPLNKRKAASMKKDFQNFLRPSSPLILLANTRGRRSA